MAKSPRKATATEWQDRLKGGRTAKILFAVPAVLTLGLVMRPTRTPDPFIFVSDPELDRRIDAYLPLMKMAAPYVMSSNRVQEDKADTLADAWIAGTERGDLKPLRPLYLTDSPFSGATGQILRTQRALANTLMVRGEQRVRAGEARPGAEDVIKAVQVYMPTRYSDLETATINGLQVRRAITSLVKAAKQMGPEDRKWLASAIQVVRPDGRQLAELGLTLRRLFEEDRWRHGKAVPDDSGIARIVALRRAPAGQETATIVDVRKQIADASSEPEMRGLVAGLQRVLASELATQKRVAKLEEVIQ